MNPPESLCCPLPWCRGAAERLTARVNGVRYGCSSCGLRFTVSIAHLEAAIAAVAKMAASPAAT